MEMDMILERRQDNVKKELAIQVKKHIDKFN